MVWWERELKTFGEDKVGLSSSIKCVLSNSRVSGNRDSAGRIYKTGK